MEYLLRSLLEVIKPVFDQFILIHFDLPLFVVLILVGIYFTRKKIEESKKEQEKHQRKIDRILRRLE